MDIALLYFDGCPSWKVADERLRAIAADRPDITVRHHRVDTVEEAGRVGFRESPSILVDGVDVFADAGRGLSCRLYQTPDGPAGAPSVDQLSAVIPDAWADLDGRGHRSARGCSRAVLRDPCAARTGLPGCSRRHHVGQLATDRVGAGDPRLQDPATPRTRAQIIAARFMRAPHHQDLHPVADADPGKDS